MKQHLVLGAVGVLTLVPVGATAQAATVQAAAPAPKKAIAMRTTLGKVVSFKGGKFRVVEGRKNIDFAVDRVTACGVSRGNRGTEIRCADLGQKQYRGKRVRVGWYTDGKKRRLAAVIAVILTK